MVGCGFHNALPHIRNSSPDFTYLFTGNIWAIILFIEVEKMKIKLNTKGKYSKKSPNQEKAVSETKVDDNLLYSLSSVTLTEEGAKPVSKNCRSVASYVQERHRLRHHSALATGQSGFVLIENTEERTKKSQHSKSTVQEKME